MARTFTSLVAEALSDDFDSTKYSTQVGVWINDCLRLLARNVRIPLADATSTPSVVAGTASYALPADFIRVYEVWNTTLHEALEEVDQDWIDQQQAASGTPEYFALYGANLVLYPTPNAATTLQLRYVKTSADISGANPLSGVIPDEYGDAVVSYCRWHLFRLEDDAEMANFWKAEFTDSFSTLRADIQHRGRGSTQVPGMWAREPRRRFVRP